MQQIKLALLRLDYLFGAAIIVCQLLNLHTLTSTFFYGTFFLTLMLWLCTTLERFDWLDLLVVLISVLAFTSVIMNGILAGAGFSFQYMKKYIMLCCTVIFFAAASKITIDEHTVRFLECLCLGIGAFLLLMFLSKNAQMHFLNGKYSQYLTFRFTNPNLTALFLSCMIMFLIAASFQERNIAWKCLLLIMAAVEAVFLYLTWSRNSMLATAAFVCISLLLFLRKKQIKLKKWILWMAAVAPLLFAVIYMKFVYNATIAKMLSYIVREGKGLDSRVSIWNQAITAFEDSPIFGAYYQISNGTGTSQLHNTHIDILASYGIIVFVMVCIFLYGVMRRKQERKQSYTQTIALVGFICALLLGIGEAALFSGGLSVYLYFGIFLLTNNEPQGIGESCEDRICK